MIDKAVLVIASVEEAPKTLSDLVSATGISRATAHRLATALETHRILRRDQDGRFTLGFELIALGRAAADQFPLADAATVALERLRESTGESVQLYVVSNDQRMCVASLESPHGLRTIVPLGAALPMNVGSAAKVLLGEPAMTKRGWAESVGEREPGVASVSAPVMDGGEIVAAVSVSGPMDRTGSNPGRRWGRRVAEAAREIERSAGFDRAR